jgi:hypothetical protein
MHDLPCGPQSVLPLRADLPLPCTYQLFTPLAGVFVGYKRADRRKAHIRELDERAEAILAAQAVGAMSGADSEGAGGDGSLAAAPPSLQGWQLPISFLMSGFCHACHTCLR